MALSMAQLEDVAGPHTTRAASEVKSHWRRIVEEAREHEVIVTNYNRPEVVVMSAERYAKLQKAAQANDPLRQLHEEFTRRFDCLQGPEAAEKLRRAFNATPEEIAEAANAAERGE